MLARPGHGNPLLRLGNRFFPGISLSQKLVDLLIVQALLLFLRSVARNDDRPDSCFRGGVQHFHEGLVDPLVNLHAARHVHQLNRVPFRQRIPAVDQHQHPRIILYGFGF